MPIPREAKTFDALVQTWYQRLEDLRSTAEIGAQQLASNNGWVYPHLMAVKRLEDTVATLQSAGIGPSELGPTIERLFGIADFMALLGEYVVIRDTAVPAVKAWLNSHNTGTYTVSTAGVVLAPYSAGEQAEIAALLAALISHWV